MDSEIAALPKPLQEIYEELPPWVNRREAERVTCRAVAVGTMANADSFGTGPATRLKVGKKVLYPKKDFVLWLASRTKIEDSLV